jgi:hypothetical protein
VLLVQEEGLVAQRRGRERASGRGPIAGVQGLRTIAAEAVQEVLDGPPFEMEGCGDSRRRLVLPEEAIPDLLTQRHRQGGRHGAPREKKDSSWSEVNIPRTLSRAKLDVALTRKTDVALTRKT